MTNDAPVSGYAGLSVPRRKRVPWFDGMLAAMADAPTRLAGVVRARIADNGGTEFSYRVVRDGPRVRCSALDGAVHVIAGTDLVWCRRDDSEDLRVEPVDPRLLPTPEDYEFGVRLFDWDRWKGTDFTEPIGGPTEVIMLGRPAWRITLAPPAHKPKPMQIVVDQQTFLTLHEGNEAFGTFHEWIELDLDPGTDESTFTWNETDVVARGHSEPSTKRATTTHAASSTVMSPQAVRDDHTMDDDFRLQMLDERLHVVEAMHVALRRSSDLLRLMAESTHEQAVERLCTEWQLDAGQAHAVLDLQIKRFGLDGAARLEEEIAFLKSDRERLERG